MIVINENAVFRIVFLIEIRSTIFAEIEVFTSFQRITERHKLGEFVLTSLTFPSSHSSFESH